MLTPEQEAYLARLADAGILSEARMAKLAELDTVRASAQLRLDGQFRNALAAADALIENAGSEFERRLAIVNRRAVSDAELLKLQKDIDSDLDVIRVAVELAQIEAQLSSLRILSN